MRISIAWKYMVVGLGILAVSCGINKESKNSVDFRTSAEDFVAENKSQLDEGEIGLTAGRRPIILDARFQRAFGQGGVFKGFSGCPILKSPSSSSDRMEWLINQTDGFGKSSGCLPNDWRRHGSGYRSNSSMRQLIVNDLPGAGISMRSDGFWAGNGRCRNDGEGWPHYLFEQKFAKNHRENQLIIGNQREIIIDLDFKVHSVTKYSCNNYDSRKHAAQFLATIKVDHIHADQHRDDKRYNGIWIQLPIYDDRIAQTREYFQDDQHGTPTFVIDQKKFRSSGSWHDGKRHQFSWNIKNEIQRGLDICKNNNECITNNSFMYKMHSISVGWELTGRFHVDSQLYSIGLSTK